MPGQSDVQRCAAYTAKSVPLAREGRRHQRCKKIAVTERTRTERSLAWETERTYPLCGTHAAMWDEGRMPQLRSDTRR